MALQISMRNVRRKRLLFASLLTLVAGTFLTIHIYSYFTQRNALIETEMRLGMEELSENLKLELENDLAIVRTLSQTFSSVKHGKGGLNRDAVNAILKTILEANPNLIGIYTAWNKNAFDQKDAFYKSQPNNHPDGAFVPYWTRDNVGNAFYTPLSYYNVPGKGDYFLVPKETKTEYVAEPQWYTLDNKAVLLVSLIAPILVDTNFLGVVGVDVSTDALEAMVAFSEFNTEQHRLYYISHRGVVVGTSDTTLQVGDTLKSELQQALLALDTPTFEIHDNDYVMHYPVYFGNYPNPWHIIYRANKHLYHRTIFFQQYGSETLGFSILFIMGVINIIFALKRKQKKALGFE